MTRIVRLHRPVALLAAALLFGSLALAADWPRWLGPEQNGSSPEKGVFGSDAPKLGLKWKRELGPAYSAVAVAGETVVTMYADGKTDWLIALKADDGTERWRYRIDTMFPKIGGADGGQLSMPVIDGDTVYALGARGQLFAVGLKDGSEIWNVRIDKELGAVAPHFGFTTTPLVVGDKLFVLTGGKEGHGLTALQKKNGKLAWQSGSDPVGYQSPIVTEIGGRRQIVASTNKSLLGLDPGGKLLWSVEHGLVGQDGWSTPVQIAEGTFVLVERNESAAFRVKPSGDAFVVAELWRDDTLKQNFAAPVIHDGFIYGYDGDFLACVDAATGARKWKARSQAAGLVLVDGRLVIYTGDGKIVVAAASPAGYAEQASIDVVEEGGYTYPTFANGAVYVRNLSAIARIDVAR